MPAEITTQSDKGGAARLSESHGVWASYAVAGLSDLPRPELFYAGIRLRDGRNVQLFVNRENGLIVVDVFDDVSKFGREVFRKIV